MPRSAANPDRLLRIGDVARATGTRVETIRWYEKVGLLTAPARSQGNYRLYDRSALDRLIFVRRSRSLGFSLDQIRALLVLAGKGDGPCRAVDTMVEAHIVEIDRKIGDLEALRSRLADRLTTCGRGAVADCHVLEALRTPGR